MQHIILFGLFALAPMALAAHTVDFDDIPGDCVNPCQSTVNLSQNCDDQTSNDEEYKHCYCGAQGAEQPMNKCASCIKSNMKPGDDDNDAAKLMKDCGWDYAALTTSGRGSMPTATVIIMSSSGGMTTTTAMPSTTTTAGAPRATAVGMGGLLAAGLVAAMI
ncbi:GPI anchored protein [Apiospora marii]|uniref:GPI anchored protein n=1 Tax=Apiospora marii TaxID=335849 RepID=A0ABR1RDN6_9PEZI